jgi:hypothetical protein
MIGAQPISQPELLPVVIGDALPTGGTVLGARVPLEVPLGVPERIEPAVPAGMLLSRSWAIAAPDTGIKDKAMRTILEILFMGLSFMSENNGQTLLKFHEQHITV